MRLTVYTFAMVILGLVAIPLLAQIPAQQVGAHSSIQVEMPLGDIEIAYVDSKEGMVLIAKCRDVSVRSKRLYLGDGRSAIMFEASSDGLFTPNGKINTAAIELKRGQTISVPPEKSERWGANRGEVYLQIAGLKFTVLER